MDAEWGGALAGAPNLLGAIMEDAGVFSLFSLAARFGGLRTANGLLLVPVEHSFGLPNIDPAAKKLT